ncbi:MAG: MBL fold metallo-hydrolase, partial [Chloroflexi bacterium]|nr:MBL fold metallo-hydrolase [Chloroflexota bacterium]
IQPMADDRLRQLTDHVWVYLPATNPRLLEPAVGIIRTAHETILVDAGNSPAHAQQIVAALGSSGAPPVKRIIYTHHHWDHTFGGETIAAPETQIIAHTRCDQRLRIYDHDIRQEAYQAPRRARITPDMIGMTLFLDLAADPNFVIRFPNVVFSTPTHELVVDALRIVSEHVGGNHTDDGTVVLVEGVLFMADAFYAPPPAAAKPGVGPDFGLIERFLAENHQFYVDGHTGVFTHDEFSRFYALRK